MNSALNFLNTGMRTMAPQMSNIAQLAAPAVTNVAQAAGQNVAQNAAQTGAGMGLNLDKLLQIASIGNQLWGTMQAGNQMKFNQNFAKQAFGMQKEAYEENKQDRQARREVDFTAGLVS